jgi:hypothetical protein
MADVVRAVSARSLAVSRSNPISTSVKDSVRHGGRGRGSIISSSSNLPRLMVFRASASGKRACDPILFLRFWARWRRRSCIGRTCASTSRVVVATILKTDKMRLSWGEQARRSYARVMFLEQKVYCSVDDERRIFSLYCIRGRSRGW